MGIACAALFGSVLAIGLLTRGRFRVALVRDGLRWEVGASPAFVAWDDMAGVSLVSFSGTQLLGVDLARPDALKTTSAQRRIARFSRPLARGRHLDHARAVSGRAGTPAGCDRRLRGRAGSAP